MIRNEKRYSTPEEYNHRLSVWQKNLEWVNKHNAEGHTYTVGMNSLADLSLEEYRAIYLRKLPVQPEAALSAPSVVPEVDWRSSGCVTPVKDQGQCGSCYSFSATAAMEFCCCRKNNSLVRLSEQQCVDCSLAYGNLGCQGGWMENCWNYYKAAGGEATEASYPYTAVKGTCKQFTPVCSPTAANTVSATEVALQAAIQARVVSVAIDAGLASFQTYVSGIYCPTGCSTTSLNHAVTAVGESSSGGDHYIIKNSWGTGWGTAGYIKMCANRNNNCGIATHARWPSC
jgi:cathepsin L